MDPLKLPNRLIMSINSCPISKSIYRQVMFFGISPPHALYTKTYPTLKILSLTHRAYIMSANIYMVIQGKYCHRRIFIGWLRDFKWFQYGGKIFSFQTSNISSKIRQKLTSLSCYVVETLFLETGKETYV